MSLTHKHNLVNEIRCDRKKIQFIFFVYTWIIICKLQKQMFVRYQDE